MAVTKNVAQATVDTDAYEPYDGFDAVLAGDPLAKVAWLRTTSGGEGLLYTGMFTVEPSTFRYSFVGDESFHVLDGELEIAVDGGETVALRPGDIASFPKGAISTWTVRTAVRKFFVISG
jgi:uncharacterized cupin superfamily protein